MSNHEGGILNFIQGAICS